MIRITGPHALAALLWFCRHGFEQVGYIRSTDACPHEEPDALLVADTCDELDLKRLLPVARQLRAGGAFIFQLLRAGSGSPEAVDWLLTSAGFTTDVRVERDRRTLFVARRRTAARLRVA